MKIKWNKTKHCILYQKNRLADAFYSFKTFGVKRENYKSNIAEIKVWNNTLPLEITPSFLLNMLWNKVHPFVLLCH